MATNYKAGRVKRLAIAFAASAVLGSGVVAVPALSADAAPKPSISQSTDFYEVNFTEARVNGV